MQEVAYRSEAALCFCCSVCSESKDSLRGLEVHLWACHLRAFPYRCSLCGYPSLTSDLLATHFAACHDPSAQVEFKRRVDQEIRLRELISQSVVYTIEEQMYARDEVPSEEVDGAIEQLHAAEDGQQMRIPEEQQLRVLQYSKEDDGIVEADETPFVPIQIHEFHDDVVQEEIVENPTEGLSEEAIGICVDEENDEQVPLAQTSYQIYEEGAYAPLEDDADHIQYVDEHGNPLDPEEIVADGEAFQELLLSRRASARFARERHIDAVVRKIAAKPRRRPPTIHQCEDCGKILKYPSKIAEHRRSHTGERPHTCMQCGASFSQKGALKCHVRLHTGEKPYPCTWECGRSFVSSSARQMHEKMHSGEKPFSCPVCMQLFSKKFHMQRHVASQHSQLDANFPTGLDAAGEDACVLASTVTEVIEDVRNAKLKKAKRLTREFFPPTDEQLFV